MTKFNLSRIVYVLLFLIGVAFLSSPVVAQNVRKFEGLIKARNGDTMVLQTSDSQDVVVVLTDDTQVGQQQGLLKAIQAGLHETQMQAEQNKAELTRQNAELQAQNAALQQQQEKVAANKAAIDAAAARFGQLDDYYILDQVMVYFANGKANVDPKYAPQLLALAEKAKTVNGYMVEVMGYASSSGSVSLNQQLSEDRADAVTNILLQQGHVPLTRMLAPGAMGETNPAGNNETDQGQAENRRVVVRVLQNKAVAGL